jgi:hypothetical protein
MAMQQSIWLYRKNQGKEVNPMGKSTLRKALAVFMAVAVMMAFTVTGAFAAGSPSKGEEYKAEKVAVAGTTYQTTTKGTATITKAPKKAKTVTVAETVKANGATYTVVKVAKGAFGKDKKLKTLKIKWKTMKGKSFSNKAFKGLKKSKIKKIKVKVNKKMSKKDYKKLVKALTKAGIKKKNIKKTL